MIADQEGPPPCSVPPPQVSAPGWFPVGMASKVQSGFPLAASKAWMWPLTPLSPPHSPTTTLPPKAAGAPETQ